MDQLDSFDRDIKSVTGFIEKIETELARLSMEWNTDPEEYTGFVRMKMEYSSLLEDVQKKREAFIASQYHGGGGGRPTNKDKKEYDRRNRMYASSRSNYLRPGDN